MTQPKPEPAAIGADAATTLQEAPLHTPGPWHAIIDKPGRYFPAGSCLVATNSEVRGVVCIDANNSGATFAESAANASLIAAAPELLDALVVAAAYLGTRVVGTGGVGETQVLPTIRAAIARATGSAA